jgi:hypothetical protein
MHVPHPEVWSNAHPSGDGSAGLYPDMNYASYPPQARSTSNMRGDNDSLYLTTVSFCSISVFVHTLLTVTSLKGFVEHLEDQGYHSGPPTRAVSQQIQLALGPPQPEYHAEIAPVRLVLPLPRFLIWICRLSDETLTAGYAQRCPT